MGQAVTIDPLLFALQGFGRGVPDPAQVAMLGMLTIEPTVVPPEVVEPVLPRVAWVWPSRAIVRAWGDVTIPADAGKGVGRAPAKGAVDIEIVPDLGRGIGAAVVVGQHSCAFDDETSPGLARVATLGAGQALELPTPSSSVANSTPQGFGFATTPGPMVQIEMAARATFEGQPLTKHPEIAIVMRYAWTPPASEGEGDVAIWLALPQALSMRLPQPRPVEMAVLPRFVEMPLPMPKPLSMPLPIGPVLQFQLPQPRPVEIQLPPTRKKT
jgi:hypothetical protein